MSKKIVVTPRGFAKCGLDNAKIMEAAGFEVVYNDTGVAYTKEEFYKITKDAVGVIVGVESVDRAYIDAHPKLKAVVKFGVGTDNIDLEYCKEKGIFVGRTVGSNSRSVAELAISFVIADSKNLYDSIGNAREHGWAKMTGYEVLDKTIGIIGFGAIGREVARMAFGLGMHVVAYDVCGIDKEFAEKFEVEEVSVEEIVKVADFISLHMPLTEETKDFISAKELNQMKSNAVLINTARGGIVNEEDLYEALKNHVIRAAYFDVFTSEPPKEDEPLLLLPNFYLTPHIASRSKEAERKTADIATKVILEALTVD
ncbi:MAG: phosphoglycerate dehydrogenase [Tyzzerella sp.]|nr:phosphoglycerate dehydrogenase [Tyzzerella sp.]